MTRTLTAFDDLGATLTIRARTAGNAVGSEVFHTPLATTSSPMSATFTLAPGAYWAEVLFADTRASGTVLPVWQETAPFSVFLGRITEVDLRSEAVVRRDFDADLDGSDNLAEISAGTDPEGAPSPLWQARLFPQTDILESSPALARLADGGLFYQGPLFSDPAAQTPGVLVLNADGSERWRWVNDQADWSLHICVLDEPRGRIICGWVTLPIDKAFLTAHRLSDGVQLFETDRATLPWYALISSSPPVVQGNGDMWLLSTDQNTVAKLHRISSNGLTIDGFDVPGDPGDWGVEWLNPHWAARPIFPSGKLVIIQSASAPAPWTLTAIDLSGATPAHAWDLDLTSSSIHSTGYSVGDSGTLYVVDGPDVRAVSEAGDVLFTTAVFDPASYPFSPPPLETTSGVVVMGPMANLPVVVALDNAGTERWRQPLFNGDLYGWARATAIAGGGIAVAGIPADAPWLRESWGALLLNDDGSTRAFLGERTVHSEVVASGDRIYFVGCAFGLLGSSAPWCEGDEYLYSLPH